MTRWAELVELYEYRVADVAAGRSPRGGQAALRHLRAELWAADLDAPLLRRLIQAEREIRQRPASEKSTDEGPTGEGRPPALEASGPAVQNSVVVAQAEALNAADHQLCVLAWNRAVRCTLQRMTRDLRHEPSQPTLRVLYAVGENAERAGRGVTERFPVPVAGDPLVSLTDREVVARLTEHFCDLLLTEQGRQQVLRALTDVQHDPFPPTAPELARREQLAAIDREPLTAHARRELRSAVLTGQAPAPDPAERPVLRGATLRLRHVVQHLLSGLPHPVPGTRRLVAAAASAGTPAPEKSRVQEKTQDQEETAARLLLDLSAPPTSTFRWHGLPVRWRAVGGGWQLQVGQQLHTLRPEWPPQQRYAALKDEQFSAELFYQDHYVLLQRLQGSPHPLGPLASQARALRLLLDPADAYANLRLARATLQDWRGRPLNLAALTPESAAPFARATPDDLQRFAREGVRLLAQRAGERSPQQIGESVQRCAAALKLPAAYAGALTGAILKTLNEPETVAPLPDLPNFFDEPYRLRPSGEFYRFDLSEKPLLLRVHDRVVTLRWNYRRALSVLIPGLANAIVEDLLVLPLGDLDLLLIHEESLVALAAVPRTPPPI